MATQCDYKPGRLHISTAMSPYNKVAENTLLFSNLVVDFSQTPLLARTLPLKPGAQFSFSSLNPQLNSLVPLTIHVVGDEVLQGVSCYKVEGNDFEGQSNYWIEKGGLHRVMRIEQPGRTAELILTPQSLPAGK